MEDDLKKKMEDNLKKKWKTTSKRKKKGRRHKKIKWKTNQSTEINQVGCDTIVNSPSLLFLTLFLQTIWKGGKYCLHLDVKTTIPISLTNTIYIETHMKTRFCKHKLYSMFCIVNIAIFSLSLFIKYLLFCITNSVLSIGHNSSL